MISVRAATDLFLLSMFRTIGASKRNSPPKVPNHMKHILLPSLLIVATFANAQNAAEPQLTADALDAAVINDLASLNDHFSGVVTFRIDKRDRLIADYISSGSTVRTDIAYFDFLDASTCAFNEEERTLMLQCQDPRSKCIDKEIHKTNIISPTGRMNLPLPSSDPKGEKARQLLVKFIEHKQDAQLSRLAETNTRGDRKK